MMSTNTIVKNISVLFLNALLLYFGWTWIIMPLFPTLPFVSYWIWIVFEMVRERLGKRVGDFGITIVSRRVNNSADPWWALILTYGVCILVMYLINAYILSAS